MRSVRLPAGAISLPGHRVRAQMAGSGRAVPHCPAKTTPATGRSTYRVTQPGRELFLRDLCFGEVLEPAEVGCYQLPKLAAQGALG